VTSQGVQLGCASRTKFVEIVVKLVVGGYMVQEAYSGELLEGRILLSSSLAVERGR
jgi:dolichyl-phosphate-mannose--protein O-mannosyl transferase